MRRWLFVVIRAAAVAAMVRLVRQLLLDRKPQRGLNGSEPVIGSLDSWPPVPRRPTS